MKTDRETLAVALFSLALCAVIGLTFAHQRASVGNSFELPAYSHLILFQDYYVIVPFMAVLAAAWFAPVRSAGLWLAQVCGSRVWLVAGVTTVALAFGSQAVYHAHPLSLDEYAVVFQSRAFAEGKLTGLFPPPLIDWLVPKWFQGRFLTLDRESGMVATVYWPGFALLLTPFTALGAPWLLNPILGGASVLVMHRLALALFGSAERAGLVVLLTLASPAVTVNAVSYYSMPAHFVANGLFALLLLPPASMGRTFAAGIVGSFALVLHNPVPHLLFALPWIAWIALQPGRWKRLGALAVGYLPLSLVLGWGWAIFLHGLGSPAGFGDLATPGGAAATFMSRLGSVMGWTSTTGLNVHLLNLAKLWLWAVPGLVTVALLGAWRLRGDRGVWAALIGSALLTYIGYFLVQFDQGHGWGYRYFHSAWLVLPLLAAAAMGGPGRTTDTPPQAVPGKSTLAGYLAGCAVLSLVVLTAFRASQVEYFIDRHLAQLPEAPHGETRIRIVNIASGYYGGDLIQNDPYLRGEIIFGSRGSSADAVLMGLAFPDYRMLSSDQRGTVWGIARQ